LQTNIGQPLPSTLVFDFPTMGALVDCLAGKLLKPESPQEISIRKPSYGRATDPAQLDGLTDEEAEALLLEELSKGKSRKP
jgi:hypothetical protein